MVDRDLVADRLADLSDRVTRIRSLRPERPEDLPKDRDAWELVVFNLMLSVQSCLDIASHLIADHAWPQASSLSDSFRRLAEQSVIAPETAERLGEAVGFRNVVAHGYGSLHVEMTIEPSYQGLRDLERFAAEVSGWLSASPRAGARGR